MPDEIENGGLMDALQAWIAEEGNAPIVTNADPPGPGVAQATFNPGIDTYIKHSYRAFKYDDDDIWGKKKVANYIEDDVVKKEEMSKEVVLTLQEISQGIVKDPAEVLLAKLREGSAILKQSGILSIGRMMYGRIYPTPKGPGKNIPVLILAHIIGNKIYTDNNSFGVDYLPTLRTKKCPLVKYLIYDLDKKKFSISDAKIFNMFCSNIGASEQLIYLSNFKYKIKNYILSSRVFGNEKVKSTLVDEVFSPITFGFGMSKRLDSETYYTSIVDVKTDKSVKFCLSDLEIILPNVKGYNIPKDKTIINGSTVFLKTNPAKPYKVLRVYSNNSSKRLCKNSENHQLDVLHLSPLDGGQSLKIYAKNIKL